ncbi:ParB/RepB/Spo0J family partition protein [Sphingomonas sp. G124]|uniref:ParB/RepB/Spo0J family partition protein n=1 Tax=Sphingomonas cremea TaxID=2904799 RepID=A0A9X1TXA7_9SPHN|nr:ParB/RepB/Spo0J family partition protein [Sphingomonas cremea]MCF2514975.1 ParB/RepB/Spo0J family partition protein [Sphingomonas cremea]
MKKATGLGRGLSALIDEAVRPAKASTSPSADGVRAIEIGRIRPNPSQPRQHFDKQAIDELAASIAERGVLQPILVRVSGDGFELIAGERRWRAAQKARLHEIPALIREVNEESSAEIALIENIQREDLNAIEEAEAYRQLIGRYGHSQEVIGKLVGKSRSHVANLLRLLDLPEAVRLMLLRGDISMGHARAVATAPDPEALALQIVDGDLSVRQAEHLAKKVRPGPGHDIGRASARNAARPMDADLSALERQLSDLLGLRVKVSHGKSGGSVSLHYSTLDQLDLICQRLSGEPI